jgi:hypothetical protein
MPKQKKSLCIFIHFSDSHYIPYYVQVYVNELARFFDEVMLLSNHRILKSVPALLNNVQITFQENIGYDFGRFYKTYKTINKDDYYRIACVNDSNILINNLDNVLEWDRIAKFDFWGLIDSYEKPWFSTLPDSYHIQSHFLVFHKNAIDLLDEYFESVGIDDILNEKDKKILRRNVINKWEIGLSQFMKSKELKIGHFLDSNAITNQFKIKQDSNISHKLYQELLVKGYPLIKKKVILDQRRVFWKKSTDWKKLIKKYGNPQLEPDTMIEELEQMKNDHKERKRPRILHKIIIHLHRKSISPDKK